ncbi:thyrotropin-releasing hormone-degrading ectoenzyme-like [Odontomachus brunneus]|uniref:thyrotropin-releasing hormone-degrading ectoenzyme-like n=1 Tax=Odontomachus brunneus TaxID=486640 RepID=UPI0013F1C8BE|nr:thyrotropin-releasing hormone-degrading ectoenzyme-like [Odontomachus brunneus]
MRLVIFLGVILKFIVPIVEGQDYIGDIVDCSYVPENLYIYDVMPMRFDINILVRPRLRILSGHVEILINITRATWNISLHAGPTYGYMDNMMANQSAKANRRAYNLHDFQFCARSNVLILEFNKKLRKGLYRLVIAYTSILNQHMEKLFYQWTLRTKNLVFTNLYTLTALLSLFPHWDDPRVKATYSISVRAPAGYTIISSVPEMPPYLIKDGLITQFGIKMVTYQFFKRPSHLIAFLIANDITMDTFEHDMHYMWHKTDTDKKFTYILEKAKIVTSFFFTFMRIDSVYFPSKINHVVLPNSPMKSMGAPGLVVYRERDITFDEALEFPSRNLDVTTLITYEMTRQLFVNVITSEPDAYYVMLNEVFASFYTYYIMDQTWVPDELMELFVVKIIQSTLNSDSHYDTEPIIHNAMNSDGIDGLFYPLLYHKKAFAIVRMMFTLYNPNTFKEAIRNYVQSRSRDVWFELEQAHSLSEESGFSVQEIMETWLKEEYCPELYIKRDYDQRIANCFSTGAKAGDKRAWIIPINYITASSRKPYNISEVIWLEWGKLKVIKDIKNNDFLILNVEQTGYYRVNYDRRNWLLISTYLQKYNFSHIPPITRAQLLNDAYYFTIQHHTGPYIFTNVTKFLKEDQNFIAWYPMFNIFSEMSTYLELDEGKSVKGHFLDIQTVIGKLGYEDNPSDNAMKKSFRHLLRKWSCKFGHWLCRNAARFRLLTYLDNDELDNIPANVKDWMICNGLKTADINFWTLFLYRIMNHTNTEKYIEYLSCPENSTVILHYLDMLTWTFRFSKIQQFTGQMYRNIVKNHIKRNDVLQFVINNYGSIINRFPEQLSVDAFLSDIYMNVYSLKDLDTVHEFGRNSSFWKPGNVSQPLEIFVNHRKAYLKKVLLKFRRFHGEIF